MSFYKYTWESCLINNNKLGKNWWGPFISIRLNSICVLIKLCLDFLCFIRQHYLCFILFNSQKTDHVLHRIAFQFSLSLVQYAIFKHTKRILLAVFFPSSWPKTRESWSALDNTFFCTATALLRKVFHPVKVRFWHSSRFDVIAQINRIKWEKRGMEVNGGSMPQYHLSWFVVGRGFLDLHKRKFKEGCARSARFRFR